MDAVRSADATRSLVVRGDPESCRLVSRALRDLAETLEETQAFLQRQADRDHPEGQWASAYRAQCRRIGGEAQHLAARVTRVEVALASLADALERAQQVLDAAATIAATRALVVDRRLVPPAEPDRGAPPWVTWREADALVGQARRIERDARRAWTDALQPDDRGPTTPATPLGPVVPCPPPQPPRHHVDRSPAPDPPREHARDHDPRRRPPPDLDVVPCGLRPP
ncbi:MAG: hypothetical protein ACR2JD_09775, partial [Nocardioides sp.]